MGGGGFVGLLAISYPSAVTAAAAAESLYVLWTQRGTYLAGDGYVY